MSGIYRFASTAGLVTAFVLFAVSSSFSQSNNPAWLEQLTQQLAVDEQCQVDYFVNMREGKLGGKYTFDARAQCRDGRQFDASKVEPAVKFTIKPCGHVVC